MAKEKTDSDERGWFARWRGSAPSSTSVSKDVRMSPTDELVGVEVAGNQPEAPLCQRPARRSPSRN